MLLTPIWRGSLTLAIIASLDLLAPVDAAFAQQPAYPFDLPPESLGASLRAYARITQTHLVVADALVAGKVAPATQGRFTAAQALDHLLAGSGLAAHAGSAGVTITAAGAPAAIESVVVTGQRRFLNAQTEGATNLPLPIEKVPQSISIVTADFIKSADLKTLGEIASYTPGAVDAGNPENNGTVIDIRGFPAGRAIDGINAIASYNPYEPDYAIFDRLEVVEGPSSVVYGISSPGGLVNYVTKSATSRTPDYLSVQFGSWDSYRLEGQVAGALDPNERIRGILLAAEDRGNSFIHDLYHHKTVLYAGLNVDFTDTLSGYIHGGYENLSRPSFDGIPTEADGAPAPLPRSFFIGSKDITETTAVYHTEGDLKWQPVDSLEVNLKGNYERTSLTGGNDYSYDLDQAGDASISAEKFAGVHVQNYGVEALSVYKLDNLGLPGSFISRAALYQDSQDDSTTLYNGNGGTINIFAGEDSIRGAFDNLLAEPGQLFPFAAEIETKTFTASGQMVIKPFKQVSILFGASYSKPDVDEVTNGAGQNFSFAGQVSYRAGLTYEIVPQVNLYASYSQSFEPQPLLTVQQNVLPPLSGAQYEAGVKYRSPNGGLLLTAAAFKIDEANVGEYDTSIDGFDYYKPIGEVDHKGIELQALGRITPNWDINAGYAYLDPKVTADTDPTIIGKTALYLPEQTFSLYTTYSLEEGRLKGLSFGGGIRFVGSERTSYDGSTENIPAYTIVDLSATYAIQKWSVQLNLHNLLNERYYINNYQTLFYGNVPGDPLNASITIRRDF